MLKYKMTDNTLMVNGRVLHQIVALKDFGMIKKGDLGGWIEDYSNLSQEGKAWVTNNACVYAFAKVSMNAFVGGNARVAGKAVVTENAIVQNNAYIYGNAEVSGHAHVCSNAHIYGDACVYGNAVIRGNAHIYGFTSIYDLADVYDNAYVYGHACVSDNALVCDNARVYDYGRVGLNAFVGGNAVVCENMTVNYSKIVTDLRTDIAASLRGQRSLLMEGHKVGAYKIVNKDLTSFYDKDFTYKIGEVAEVENPDETNASCASGLHFSNLTYWDCHVDNYFNRVYLVAETALNDIITIQQGKIRCRKAKILNAVDI